MSLDTLQDRAEAFVSGMNSTERITWLQGQSYTDLQILDALLNPDDRELDEFTRDAAGSIAAQAANGSLTPLPGWLQ